MESTTICRGAATATETITVHEMGINKSGKSNSWEAVMPFIHPCGILCEQRTTYFVKLLLSDLQLSRRLSDVVEERTLTLEINTISSQLVGCQMGYRESNVASRRLVDFSSLQ